MVCQVRHTRVRNLCIVRHTRVRRLCFMLTISLEGMMLKLKLQYFGHLMWRVDSLENTLMLGGIGGRRRRGRQRMRWLDGITDSMDVSEWTEWTPFWVNSGSWWWTGRPGVLRFMGWQRVGHDWATDLIWSDPSGRFRNKYFKLQISNYIVIHFTNVIKEVSLILSHNMEREYPFEIQYQLVRDHTRWKDIKMRWSQSQNGWGQSVPNERI